MENLGRRLLALDVGKAVDGALEVALVQSSGELGRRSVPRVRLAARDAIVESLNRHLATRDLTSLLACSGASSGLVKGALAALDGVELRAQLDRWDFDHLVRPWLGELARRPCVVLTASDAGTLPHHSLRGALRQAIREGALAPELIARVNALPMWSGAGPRSLTISGENVMLPPVVPTELCFLVGPPPGDIEAQLAATVAAGVPLEVLADEVDGSPQILHGAVQGGVIRRLARTLAQSARACGARYILPATSGDLINALSRLDRGTLVLIAHHDRQHDGLLLADGILPHRALARLAVDWSATRRAPRHASVDLCVCDAEAPGGLAEIVQHLGIPVVLARRGYALLADCLVGWREYLATLEVVGPVPLPLLMDLSWLRRSERTPMP